MLLLLLSLLPALCEASGALQPPERGPHRRDVVGLPCLSCPGAVYAAGHLEAEAHERRAPQQDVARCVLLLSAEGAEPASACGPPALRALRDRHLSYPV